MKSTIIVPSIMAGYLFGAQVEAHEERFFQFPRALPGKVIKVHKRLNAETGKMVTVTDQPEADGISIIALDAEEQRLNKVERGSLFPAFHEELSHSGPLDAFRVRVRVKSSEVVPLDKTRHSEEELRRNAQEILSASPVRPILEVLARYGVTAESESGADMAVAVVDKLRLLAMKNDPDIASIWKEVKHEKLAPEVSSLAPAAYMSSVPSGAGSGVKAATFEDGITSSFLSCLGISATYDSWTTGDDDDKRHTQAVFRSLAATAPSASLYHRRSWTFNGTNDVSYIVNNGIQTLSMSSARGGTSPFSATYSEFLTMDNMAYTYPYPVFVNPAGNSGYDYAVNWQCYNAISVGNVRHTNSNTYELAECTQTKNPAPRYGSCISGSGSSCAGDREMPHVVVPGIPSTGSTFATTCLEGSGSLVGGTSWTAPVGNGIAAAVIAADSRMISWPEKVRATLILTAQNVESGHWTDGTDERDGSGVVSGTDAIAFAQSHTSVSPGNTACEKGMGATSFYASDFSSNKRFYYSVPNPKPSGKHLRVVLTWDSNPSVSNGTNDMCDLDLIVQKNDTTQHSGAWDTNVEVVDVAASALTAGSTYFIDISPYANRMPVGSNYFYYAIAWAWVADEAP